MSQEWPNQIARITNHIHFHRKSAERETLRHLGYTSFIGKYDVQKVVEKLQPSQKTKFEQDVKMLEGKFRMYSLHCGGIVFYPNGVPTELILKNGLIDQVKLDKRNVADEKQFKIDMLSSKALSQVYCINKSISFDTIETRSEIFKRGDNLGITLAESPLIRTTFIRFQLETIEDLAVCLSVIRPIAKTSRKKGEVDGIADGRVS